MEFLKADRTIPVRRAHRESSRRHARNSGHPVTRTGRDENSQLTEYWITAFAVMTASDRDYLEKNRCHYSSFR
jgi:hypothetical protein